MIGVDLFAGAGGMSLGAIAAGVDVALAVELDKFAAATYAANHPGTDLFRGDIRDLRRSHLPKVNRRREQTVVFGGPPCQGFSYSNLRTRSSDNPNNWLFIEFMRVVQLWEPDWVVFENVKGLTNTEGGIFLDQVLGHLGKQGYTVSKGVLDAVKFGVPQHRERFFAVGSRNGVKLDLPTQNTPARYTVFDAIGDLPPLENGASTSWLPYGNGEPSKYAKTMRSRRTTSPNHLVSRNAPSIVKRYQHIPQGGNWEDIPARLMKSYANRSRCHTGIYHRLDNSRQSIVIGNYRKNMLIHPTEDRGLSVREAARIQSFPDRYEFIGSIGFQQQQVGNAVPPVLAEGVFRGVMAAQDEAQGGRGYRIAGEERMIKVGGSRVGYSQI
jgi:DNA (cytosine-5)-methyltransferase 1